MSPALSKYAIAIKRAESRSPTAPQRADKSNLVPHQPVHCDWRRRRSDQGAFLYFAPATCAGLTRFALQLWDPRIKTTSTAQKTYTHHWDYISSFLYFEDKKQLISTSYVFISPLIFWDRC